MVSVVDLKNRAIERLEAFRDNARSLPALTHARYERAEPLKGQKHRPVNLGNFALRKHRPHQMHSQHRNNCVLVLQWLIKRMDVKTRQCVFVNPSFNIRRTIYVPEIARHTGLCERTVSRVLSSLTRGRYLLRTVVGITNQRYLYFLSQQLFRDLKLDITLGVLVRRMLGLEKKGQMNGTKPIQSSASKTAAPATSFTPPSDGEKPYANLPQLTEAGRSVGNSFLDQLRRRRPKPPG